MVIIRIYGARTIILLIYDDEDTLSTECEIEMTISQLIFANKNISKAIWDNDIQTIQNGRNTMWSFFIFMELETFFYSFKMTKTLKKSNRKYK